VLVNTVKSSRKDGMGRFPLRYAILLTAPLCVSGAPLPAQDAAAQLTAGELVEQLGADDFIRRQLAMEALTERGLPALEAVKKGTEHPDPEVRFRARQVLRAIRHLDRQRLINAFAAGQVASVADELPGWPEYRALAGDDDEARSLFVEMVESEWAFLESIFRDETVQPNALLAERCQNLQNILRLRRTVPVGSIAALLLAASRDDVDLSSQPYLLSFCYLGDFEQSMRVGSRRQALRALLGSLVARDSVDAMLTQRLHFALHYDMPEGLQPARRVLGNGDAISSVKQFAILVLTKMGTPADNQLLENALDDSTVVANQRRVNNVPITTQVRDLALAGLLYRANEDFQDFGLPPIRPHPTTIFVTTAIGFPSDEAREKAILQWRQKHSGHEETAPE
jgi:hypothetical protein